MFEIIRKIWKTGTVTSKLPFEAAPPRYRGKLSIQDPGCADCEECVKICPTGAITICQTVMGRTVEVSYGKCIFCGLCAEACKNKNIKITQDYHLATRNKADLVQTAKMSRE